MARKGLKERLTLNRSFENTMSGSMLRVGSQGMLQAQSTSRLMAFQPAAAPRGRRCLTVTAAKKGGKGGNKKGPGSLMDIPKKAAAPAKGANDKPPYLETSVIMHNLLLIESHYRKVGKPILENVEISEAAKALWEAPFAVLAHDGKDKDARFTYGNKAALGLFECTWDELIGTPSVQSAEAVDEIQTERLDLLKATVEKGFSTGYEAWRVSFKGTRFKILGATLFNIEAPSGELKGQCAVIPQWEYEDGTKGGLGAEEGAAAAGGAPPTPEDVQAAEAAVQEQATAVRQLKESQGLSNSDPEVQAAVEELLSRKQRLEQLQQRLAASEAATAEQAADAAPADG